jgi:hypothetical protein
MRGFFATPGTGVGFFFSSWLTMIFWGIISPDPGIPTIGYATALLVTIAAGLVVAPLVGTMGRRRK